MALYVIFSYAACVLFVYFMRLLGEEGRKADESRLIRNLVRERSPTPWTWERTMFWATASMAVLAAYMLLRKDERD